MRLWTLHPRYLDTAGLLAVWREGLLAQAVLRGATRGYRAHPQLVRFRECSCPVAAIATYLAAIREEALRRDYRFDETRLAPERTTQTIEVPEGQLLYEWTHLRRKLWQRDRHWHRSLAGITCPDPHPLFQVVPGPVCSWERLQRRKKVEVRR